MRVGSRADTNRSTSAVLRCERVGVRFDEWALRNVDFQLYPGEVVGLVGPGGHGKSVLLKCLPGLIRPDEGRVLVDESIDLATLKPAQLHDVREGMGYLFQNYALFDFMTVRDNVVFPLRQQAAGGQADAELVERAERRLAEVGLGAAFDLYPRELSGGMKKRVGLARATISEPRIGLYDDPSAGLDPVTSSKIFELIERLHQRVEGAATVIISHDIDRMRAVCDRYVFLWRGEVLFKGRLADVAAADERVRAFFNTTAGTTAERRT